MKPISTLDEARKYLIYVTEALYSVSKLHSLDKQERMVLEKYSEDLFQYADGLEQVKNIIAAKEQKKQNDLE